MILFRELDITIPIIQTDIGTIMIHIAMVVVFILDMIMHTRIIHPMLVLDSAGVLVGVLAIVGAILMAVGVLLLITVTLIMAVITEADIGLDIIMAIGMDIIMADIGEGDVIIHAT